MNEDKSNKRKDPPTKDTTNTNKKKIDKYFVFQTGSDNNKYYAFESKSDADDFLADFGAVVTKKDTFHLKAEFLAHKKQLDKIALKNTPTTPKPTPTKKKEQLSPEDAASVEKAVRRIIDLRPKNEIVLHWKTTKTSHACLVLVRFKDKRSVLESAHCSVLQDITYCELSIWGQIGFSCRFCTRSYGGISFSPQLSVHNAQN